MYNKIMSIPLLVIGITMIIVGNSGIAEDGLSGWQIAGIVIGAIGFGWMFFSLLGSLCSATEQRSRFAAIHGLQRKITVAQEYKDKVESEMKNLLTVEFPNFEKDLLSKFSFANEKDKDALLAICPTLKSSECFESYVKKLYKAMEDVRTVEIEKIEIIQSIMEYRDSSWPWFKVAIPDNVKLTLIEFEK